MYDFMWGEAFLYKVEQFPHRLVQWSTIGSFWYEHPDSWSYSDDVDDEV